MKFTKIALLALLILAVALMMFACPAGDPTPGTGSSGTTSSTRPNGNQPDNPGSGNQPGEGGGNTDTEDTTPGKITFTVLNETECAVSGHTGKFEGTLTVPAEYVDGGKTYAVTEIAAGAFANCKYVTAVVIPDSVRTVGQGAFAGCSAITELTLPFVGGSLESNTYIGYIFGASSFAENGAVVPAGLAKVTLGNLCTAISPFAFDSCEALAEIQLGSGITRIGSYAFAHCALTAPVVPSSVVAIGIGAFADCPIESMVLPFIGDAANGAFGHIGYLFGATEYRLNGDYIPATLSAIEIADGCTSIGAGAFNDCAALATITLPDTIVAIGRDAFTGTAFYANQPNGLVYVGKVLYNYKGEMTSSDITLREDTIAIAAAAFEGLEITSISIPATVTNIGKGAFYGSKLTSLTLSFVGGSADATSSSDFFGYIFGASAASENATYVPTTLTSVTLTDACATVADSAFLGCAGITSVTVGSGVESIAKNAFFGCTELATITVSAQNTAYKNDSGLVYNKEGNDLVAVPLAQTGSVTLLNVTEIGDSQFAGSSLSTVVLPATLESIGAYAFDGATALATLNFPAVLNAVGYAAFRDTAWFDAQPDGIVYTGNVLYRFKGASTDGATVTVGNHVSGIAAGAFENCSISAVVIPSNVETIGAGAFKGCEVVSMTLPYIGATANSDEVNNFIGYLFGAPTAILSASYIPATLTSVTLLDSCTFIGTGAFAGCANVSELVIPDSVVSIAAESLHNTAWYAAQKEPGVIYAGRVVYGFIPHKMTYAEIVAANAALEEGAEPIVNVYDVTLREGTVAIVDAAFQASDLHEIRMPDSLLTIGANVFENCRNLVYVNMSSNLTSLGRRAFYSCSLLPEIYIPGSVSEIPAQAFARCSALKTIIIGKGVSYIGENALNGVDLQKVYYTGGQREWSNNVAIDDSNQVFQYPLDFKFNYIYEKSEH